MPKLNQYSAICFSGSFDPPHRAHREALRVLRSQYPDLPIFVLPIASNPYKTPIRLSLKIREDLLRRFTRTISRCQVDVSIARSLMNQNNHASYIYYYLTALANKHSITKKIGFVIGSDLRDQISQWHRYSELKKLVDFIVLNRGQKADIKLEDSLQHYSSTALRFFLAAGFEQEIEHFFPTYTKKNIRDLHSAFADKSFLKLYHRLEHSSTAYNHLARSALSSRRFEHSARVARLSCYLGHLISSRGEKLSLRAMYIAAILHDIAREWSNKTLLNYAHKHGIITEALQQENPVLLHGPCAAHMLRHVFSLSPLITEAICHHTLGRGNSSMTALLLKLADLIEPQRHPRTLKYIAEVFEHLSQLQDLNGASAVPASSNSPAVPASSNSPAVPASSNSPAVSNSPTSSLAATAKGYSFTKYFGDMIVQITQPYRNALS